MSTSDKHITKDKQRIVILGAGFGGLYTALKLESLLSWHDDYEIILINRENYFVYQPMLAEIISGNVGIFDTTSPLRQLLRKTQILVRDIEHVDLENKRITASPGIVPIPHVIDYDHLVISLGNVTDFRGMTGLTQHALPFKNMEDALNLRHHVIHSLEEASIEPDMGVRRALLTFVVAGGGWSGVECVAEINSLVRGVIHTYRGIDPEEVKIILLHAGENILEQLVPKLRVLARQVLERNGVEIRFHSMLTAATGTEAIVKRAGELERIPTRTLVSTVPSSPNPIVESLGLPDLRGRVLTDKFMQVEGSDHLWAVGDCAAIPDPSDPQGKGICPPTAQHAVRQGEVAAYNIVASIRNAKKKPFKFKGLGTMGALGHHSAVAQVMGMRLSGLPAWLMWRGVYLMKMPGWDRRIRTATAWGLSLILPTDIVELRLEESRGVVQEHYEAGQVIFNQNDIGDRLYIILKGRCEVVQMENGFPRRLAELGTGQFFGEMALLNNTNRGATVRATEPMDVLSVPKRDMSAMVDHLPALRESFQHIIDERDRQNLVRRQARSYPAPDPSAIMPATLNGSASERALLTQGNGYACDADIAQAQELSHDSAPADPAAVN